MFIRFDRIHERDGRTDGHTDRQTDRHRMTGPRLHSIAQQKYIKIFKHIVSTFGKLLFVEVYSLNQLTSTIWIKRCHVWRNHSSEDVYTQTVSFTLVAHSRMNKSFLSHHVLVYLVYKSRGLKQKLTRSLRERKLRQGRNVNRK